MRTVIIGMGQIGKSLEEILKTHYEIFTRDIDEEIPAKCPMMHVCIRYSDQFLNTVAAYAKEYQSRIINVCTTVPPGITGLLSGLTGVSAVHSTTRGLHPNLVQGLKTITKHIGGPKAEEVARYFKRAGVPCITHRQAKTTELAHLLNNVAYALNVAFADEMAAICRQFGVDYQEAVIHYTQTNNEGFHKLDHDSKCRMILTPPGGKIGGHCLVQAANMLKAAGASGAGLDMVSKYGV